ncbi:MAG: AraC family transcriptional regulator [Bacteroidaceae bacterium]|nr:AraC family transcriptional regulator [Bacteroidaceae bacterium]
MIKETPITQVNAQNLFFSSYQGKYFIIDNLEEKGEPILHATDEMYNSEYVHITIVLRGTLHAVIGGTEIEVKANQYLVVMPCISVTIKESRCIFISSYVPNHIISEIFDRTAIGKKLQIRAFEFRHINLTPELTEALLHCHQCSREEHLRPDYPMKEIVLRSYLSAGLAKLYSNITSESIIHHMKNGRQYKLFLQFLQILNEEHKRERSVQFYAQKLQITPKYLSSIVHNYTGLTASQAIDQDVIFSVKQALYTNQHNIKSISREFNFPSQSFFGRYFKRITGLSPFEYIKQHNIKSINFV